MKPSDALGFVIRVVGLAMCILALPMLGWAALNVALGGPANVILLTVSGVPLGLAGLWFLRGAPSLMAFAFPGEQARTG